MHRHTRPSAPTVSSGRDLVQPTPLRNSPARLGLRGRLRELRTADEAGAQVVEYAMLGAVAAATCGALLALIRGGLLQTLMESITNGLVQWVQTWFA
ncbi:MAG: Flp family type IVb pilin [Egibacteraceae bacterium]